MKILESYKNFKIEVGDNVLIHYWWDDHITVCEVVERKGRKYLLSHNTNKSHIKNAPNEWVKKDEIITKV